MSHILVADVPGGVATMRNVIGDRARIVSVATLEGAVHALGTEITLIVCGLHFDESRMFDLLRIAKSDPKTRFIPFLCLRNIDSELPRPLLQGLEIACTALGAVAFVDLYELKQQRGLSGADEHFRKLLEGFLRSTAPPS